MFITLNSETIVIKANSVSSTKSKLEFLTGINPSTYKLRYNAKTLDDNVIFAEYGINEDFIFNVSRKIGYCPSRKRCRTL